MVAAKPNAANNILSMFYSLPSEFLYKIRQNPLWILPWFNVYHYYNIQLKLLTFTNATIIQIYHL